MVSVRLNVRAATDAVGRVGYFAYCMWFDVLRDTPLHTTTRAALGNESCVAKGRCNTPVR
jgi:hypothetical protein